MPDALYIQSLDMLDQSIRSSYADIGSSVCIHSNIPIGAGFETGIILNSNFDLVKPKEKNYKIAADVSL